ncbi:MAG: response regulator [Cellvibrionaceae bacterium]
MNLKKALIVDDSRLAQFVLKKMLVEHDLEVDTSESAEDALGYLSRQKPDMIFLDHTMPGMNGLEVLKVIKDNPDTSAIPVMMYTSQEDSTYMSKARELGAIDVLPKQLKPIELKQALTRLDTEATVDETIPQQAANEPVKNNDKEELEQLVIHAEAALEQETIEQQLRLRINEQKTQFDEEIAELHQKMDLLIPAAENANNKQSFWNNLFWGAIYLVTVTIFTTVYFQQQSKINLLSSAQNNVAPTKVTKDTVAPTPVSTAIVSEQSARQTNNNQTLAAASPPRARISSNAQDVSSLEQLFNTNNQIPYDELLLGDTVQASLNELIPALQALEFSGRVNILAHDGSFCVSTGASGQFELAADDIAVTQCQITEASGRLADIASIDLLQLITASNQSAESDFVITINPLSTTQPIESYPPVQEETSAGDWNTTALKNRRVDIQLIKEG